MAQPTPREALIEALRLLSEYPSATRAEASVGALDAYLDSRTNAWNHCQCGHDGAVHDLGNACLTPGCDCYHFRIARQREMADLAALVLLSIPAILAPGP